MLCSMSCNTHSQIHYFIGVWPPEKRLRHTMAVQTPDSKVSLSLSNFFYPSFRHRRPSQKETYLYWQLWMFLISCSSARGTPSEHPPFDKSFHQGSFLTSQCNLFFCSLLMKNKQSNQSPESENVLCQTWLVFSCMFFVRTMQNFNTDFY